MAESIIAGSTDQSIDVFIQDPDSLVGLGLAGLEHDDALLQVYYRRGATGTPTELATVVQTVGGVHSDGGWIEVDSTNMTGVYRLDLSDAIVAHGVDNVTLFIYYTTAGTIVPCPIVIPLYDDLVIRGTVDDAGAVAGDFVGLGRGLTLNAGDTFYETMWLVFTDGVLRGIPREVTTYTGGTTHFTFATAFPAAPANGDPWQLLGSKPA